MKVCALLDNGEFGEVIAEAPEALTIRLFNGGIVTLPPSEVWVLT